MLKIVPSVCCNDCGGACPLNIYVEDGRIVKIEARDVGSPAMRPCAKGLLYHYAVYADDRLRYPMRRVGERGEGQFVRISWDEALGKVAEQLTRIRREYGPAAILKLTRAGNIGRLHHADAILRWFLSLAGGYTDTWGNASNNGGRFASLANYGTVQTGNERADLLNSRMIILWGSNPAENVFGTETRWYLTQAKEKGTRIIGVDPRLTDSIAAWASQWIPIRPGTDASMMVAMAYVIIDQGLESQRFLDTYTVGFDRFRSYVMGGEDGIAKTPSWARAITGVPADTIRTLAIEYATTKPAAIIPGWAPGRTSQGEQYHRASAVLSAMTGNIGVPGGSTACLDRTGWVMPPSADETMPPVASTELPVPRNPVSEAASRHKDAVRGIWDHTEDKVHLTKVWDNILKGKGGGYFSDLKMAYVVGSNALNQYCDASMAVEALKKLEFVIVHEQFMTPTARFADILLPVCTWCECSDAKLAWAFGYYVLYANKAIEPMYESRTDLQILTELAAKMGIRGYSDKTEDDWLRLFAARWGIADYDAFKADGFYKLKTAQPYVAFRNQIDDPKHFPFPTPSGRIEIFCQRIADFNHPDALPPIPKYVEGWEGPTDPRHKKYPLQLITPHSRRRVHSQFDNIPWHSSLEPHEAWISPADAKPRNIKSGDQIRAFNDRGAIRILAKVTDRIMPGVVCVYEGAWYTPDASGLDRRGCANVLTRAEHSPGGAFCGSTSLVQVERI